MFSGSKVIVDFNLELAWARVLVAQILYIKYFWDPWPMYKIWGLNSYLYFWIFTLISPLLHSKYYDEWQFCHLNFTHFWQKNASKSKSIRSWCLKFWAEIIDPKSALCAKFYYPKQRFKRFMKLFTSIQLK